MPSSRTPDGMLDAPLLPPDRFFLPVPAAEGSEEDEERREERSWLFASASSVVVVVEVDGEDEVVRRQWRGAWRRRRRRREVGTERDGEGGEGRSDELRRRERSLQERMSMAAMGVLGGGGASLSLCSDSWLGWVEGERPHSTNPVARGVYG